MRGLRSNRLSCLLFLLVPTAGCAQDSVLTVSDPTVLVGHRGEVTHIDFSADGQQLVSSGGDSTVRVWLVEGGRQVRVIPGTNPGCGAFMAGDGRIVAAMRGGRIGVWPAGGTTPARTLGSVGHQSCVAALARDRASIFITTYRDGDDETTSGAPYTNFLEQWDLGAGVRRRRLQIDAYIDGLDVGSTGSALLLDKTLEGSHPSAFPGENTTFVMRELNVFDLRTWSSRGLYFSDLELPVLREISLSEQPVGSLVAKFSSSSDRQTVVVWSDSVPSGKENQVPSGLNLRPLRELLLPKGIEAGATLTDIQFSPDGQFLAVATSTGQVLEWAVNSWHPSRIFTGASGSLSQLRYSPDGRRIAAGSSTGSVVVWTR